MQCHGHSGMKGRLLGRGRCGGGIQQGMTGTHGWDLGRERQQVQSSSLLMAKVALGGGHCPPPRLRFPSLLPEHGG